MFEIFNDDLVWALADALDEPRAEASELLHRFEVELLAAEFEARWLAEVN